MQCQAGGCRAQAVCKAVCGTCRNYGDSATRNFCENHRNNRLPCGHPGNYFWAAGYRFPNTSTTTRFTTNSNHVTDWDRVTKHIDKARNLVRREYIFCGETHACCYDKEMTRRLARRYGGDNRVIFVAERGILGSGDNFWPNADRPDNVVLEQDVRSTSGSPLRNSNLVEQIVMATDEDDAARGVGSPKPVVIVCGDDHGNKLRDELVKQAGYFRETDGRETPTNILWSHYVSADDVIAARASVAPGTMSLVGFAEFTNTNNYAGAQPAALLEKDIFIAAFDLTVVNDLALGASYDGNLARSSYHFAVYMPAGAGRTAVLAALDLDGEHVLRVTGKPVARLSLINSQAAYTAGVDEVRAARLAREG